MKSHCLNHQGREATNRCVSCLKPLCQDCVQLYEEGIFCSEPCHESAKAAEIRGLQMAHADAELKAWKQKQFAIKTVTFAVVAGFLYFGWDHLPAVVTDNVEKVWDAVMDFLKSIFPGMA